MRTCGTCTLCCKLLPVRELAKPAGKKCEHQRFNGCAIYSERPPSCRMWSCRWLTDQDTADLRRPDRVHYCIDIMPDFITLDPGDGGEQFKIEVVQVWVDPRHPDAHRDPALRAFMRRRARDGIATLVRFDSSRGMTIFAPELALDHEWHEVGGIAKPGHSPREIVEALTEVRAQREAGHA